ncbi:signal peptidase II [Enterococcus asini]|uniref:signal peptidase II n=1 Tax=Enterococcus asini TaxID=57732 RepID=UPI001E5A4242|nr:signal peptidase II [Enterococcus asini]MCD5028429.1 signal peptidase II [Enterococcus asini]MDT2743203.1 signal peptidase II [Enterococcus asini]MDT2763240.1 signal peptidase II [Enterococcus asini]MDT2783368.1 signal peptidase II [Enterococcus asini]
MISYLIVAALLVVCDQLVKYWVVSNLSLGEAMNVIPNVFSLTYYQNSGAAWSILQGQMWFFAIVTFVAVPLCIWLLWKNRRGSKFYSLALGLVIAGALGNFIDRMRLGYVVDMFQTDFMNFPIFNVADMCLTIGVVMVFIYALFEERFERKEK